MATIFTSWKVHVFGLLTWLIPFLAAFPFYSPDQGLLIPITFFKSIMIVIGSAVGLILLVWLYLDFPKVRASGLIIGLYWLALNWVLDILILLPMSGSDIGTWFTDIGLRYLVLPMMAIAICYTRMRARQS
ncbi:MAG: hypothetical protein KDJ19_07420 [Hyphomicrobiaceae bacterium]|nr:hypothetical protein [Hyphomicrobiaceae bacterium]MCC0024854.1 hypothetical protein [Hyphomicrobiaceae bacterium]